MWLPADASKTISTDLSLTLNGGSFNISGDGTWAPPNALGPNIDGNNVTFKGLTLSDTSYISMGLGNGSGTITFTDKWTDENGNEFNTGGHMLSIFGWGDDAISTRRIVTGTAPDASFLSNIWFEGYGTGATMSGSDIIPANPYVAPVPPAVIGRFGHACILAVVIPEPSTWLGGCSVVAFAFMHYVRRRR